MRQAGAQIAIDDAGAGYSGLQHIVQIKPDVIKIDTSLVRDIDQDPARRATDVGTHLFARETASTMIAGRRGNRSRTHDAREARVTKAQGYLFGQAFAD